jgi:hypothetical protein
MDIAFHVPQWLLYVGGGLLGLFVLAFALFGVACMVALSRGIWR